MIPGVAIVRSPADGAGAPTPDAIEEARGRIRTSLRIARNIEITLRAYDDSDDYDQLNDGSVLRLELAMALDALGEN